MAPLPHGANGPSGVVVAENVELEHEPERASVKELEVARAREKYKSYVLQAKNVLNYPIHSVKVTMELYRVLLAVTKPIKVTGRGL
jgi:hypothetical protein